MKVSKIKNLPNKHEILKLLTMLVKADECNNGNWPLTDAKNLPTENFYVVINNGKVIPAYTEIKNNEALVLWVDKNHRRQGYAAFLINTLNIKYTVAHEPSLKFWQSLGFKRISKIHGFGPIEMKRSSTLK